jgi:hypothetical protein
MSNTIGLVLFFFIAFVILVAFLNAANGGVYIQ